MSKLLNFLTIPVLIIPVFYVMVIILTSSDDVSWQWAIVSAITLILFPTISLFWLRFEHEISGIDLDVKKERIVSFGLLVLLYATSFINAYLLAAPKVIQALNLNLFILIMLLLGISYVWKISGHMVAIAQMTIIVWFLQGMMALLFIPLAVFVGWQRYYLKHHTQEQIIAGWILSALITYFIFKIYGL